MTPKKVTTKVQEKCEFMISQFVPWLVLPALRVLLASARGPAQNRGRMAVDHSSNGTSRAILLLGNARNHS